MAYPTPLARLRQVAPGAALATVQLVLCLAALPGCSTNPEAPVETFPTVPVPLPPTFMNGPIALLLTNSAPYAAQLTLTEHIGDQDETLSGDLLVQGGRILFAPHLANEGRHRYAKEGRFSFLWMVAENRGFVLSEAMQGYAPVGLGTTATNIVSEPGGPGEFLDGHRCQVEMAAAKLKDGSAAYFKAWRATDLKNVPLRILSLSNSPAVTVTLTKVRSQVVPQELLAPPSGFTRFNSAETMADELALRQRNLKRKSWEAY